MTIFISTFNLESQAYITYFFYTLTKLVIWQNDDAVFNREPSEP